MVTSYCTNYTRFRTNYKYKLQVQNSAKQYKTVWNSVQRKVTADLSQSQEIPHIAVHGADLLLYSTHLDTVII